MRHCLHYTYCAPANRSNARQHVGELATTVYLIKRRHVHANYDRSDIAAVLRTFEGHSLTPPTVRSEDVGKIVVRTAILRTTPIHVSY